MKKDNIIINRISLNELGKSYSWENTRNTFPPRYWQEIIVQFLRHGSEKGFKTLLQKIYKINLPKSNLNKSDQNMHINVLLKKLLISDVQDFDNFKKISIFDLHRMVSKHINEITAEMKRAKISKNWKKNIYEWEELTESKNGEFEIVNYGHTQLEKIITNTLDKKKIIEKKEIKNNFSYTWNASKNDFISSVNLEKIGKIGEQIVYLLLVKKYGLKNVIWMSSIDKFSPYDIHYFDKGVKKYVEVKSSTRINKIHWYISRNEYDFYKKKKDNYILIFVKDINSQSKNGAYVEKMEKPNIEISNNKYGIDSNKLIITPIKYKGLA